MAECLLKKYGEEMAEKVLLPELDEKVFLESLSSEVSKTVFDNGLTLLAKEIYPVSAVCLGVWVKTGSLDEPEEKLGISHMVEHMLFKNTKNRKVGQIAMEVHSLGGYLNGFTSYDCTCFWIVLPGRFFDTALDIQADAILNPVFSPAEVAKEKKVIIEEMHMYDDRPECHCFDKLMKLAYTKHKMRHPIVGYENTVRDISAQSLISYYKRFYNAGNIVVVAAGNIKISKIINKVSLAFKELDKGFLNKRKLSLEPLQKAPRRLKIAGDVKNVHLIMGFHIPSLFQEDIFPLDILSTILGDGLSSRLNVSLREDKGIVSSISASILAEQYPGLFMIEAVSELENKNKVEEAIWKEIEKIKINPASSEEILKAKNMLESDFIFSQEVVQNQARRLGYFEILGDYKFSDIYLKKLLEVNQKDISRAAGRYLNLNNSNTVEYLESPA